SWLVVFAFLTQRIGDCRVPLCTLRLRALCVSILAMRPSRGLLFVSFVCFVVKKRTASWLALVKTIRVIRGSKRRDLTTDKILAGRAGGVFAGSPWVRVLAVRTWLLWWLMIRVAVGKFLSP